MSPKTASASITFYVLRFISSRACRGTLYVYRHRYAWGLGLILLVAALLRLVSLDRLPPGLSYDEALNDLFASRLTLLPPPVFIASEFGEEPAHMILIAILYRLAGRPFAEAGRLVSALGGISTVGLLFFATREMFRPRLSESQARAIGLLSAGVLAILYWHVHYSRLGMEPTMVPTFSVPAFYVFWLALNRQRWPLFALAGGMLGLCLYTYAAGYATPFVIVFYLAWRWLSTPGTLKAEWHNILVYVTGALVAYAPHLAFFALHPEWLAARPAMASVSEDKAGYGLLQNAVKMVAGLFWRGDTNLRLNLPGRPALDPVQSVAWLAGIAQGLRWPQRDGVAFALIWLGVMSVPSVASDVSPHFGRALGATPPLAILVGLGLWELGRQAHKLSKAAGLLLVGLALAYSGVRTVNDYFNVWANEPGLFKAFEVALRESSEYLAALPPDNLLSLSPTPRHAPIFDFYLGARGDRFKTFNGRRCVVYPYQPSSDFVHTAIVADEQTSLAALEELFPSGQVVHKIFDRGVRQAVIYRVPAGTRARIELEPVAAFAGNIELARQARLAAGQFKPGETVPLTITWRALATPGIAYTSFIHLARQANEAPLAQEDAQPCDNSYPTTWWAQDEIVEEWRFIHLPPDLPAGRYVLSAGWYDQATGQRLPASSGGDYVILATIQVEP